MSGIRCPRQNCCSRLAGTCYCDVFVHCVRAGVGRRIWQTVSELNATDLEQLEMQRAVDVFDFYNGTAALAEQQISRGRGA